MLLLNREVISNNRDGTKEGIDWLLEMNLTEYCASR